jgi:hypothetical protein
MPLGIISEEDLAKELGNNEPIARVQDLPTKGRPEGSLEVPDELRKIISEEAINGTPSKELQELFNVSASSISAYKNGATSTATYNEPNKELATHNLEIRKDIQKRAAGKLELALESMRPEKFEKANLRILAGVASQLSAVVKNMEPDNRERQNDAPLAQFVFMVPPMKRESDYEIIQVEN